MYGHFTVSELQALRDKLQASLTARLTEPTEAAGANRSVKYAVRVQDIRRELGLSRGKSRGGDREGDGAAKVDWPPGCAACGDSGLRRVLRHVRDPRDRPVELFSAACNCDLGRARHQHQRVAYLADVVAAWTAAPSTFDGPFIDPGPEHHVAPDRRAEFVARAEARLAETRGVVDHLAAAAAPTRDTRPWFERDGVPA